MSEVKHILSWFELPVSDMDRATRFYESIFDIKLIPKQLGKTLRMAVFPGGQSVVGGALVWNEEWYTSSNSRGPLIYFDANPDLLSVQNKVEAAGGKVTISKRAIGQNNGFMAVFEDTEGNRVALFSNQ